MQAPTGASGDGRRSSKRRRSLEVFEKHGLLTQSCSALLTQICSVFLTLCSVEVLTSEEPVWDIPSPVDSLGDPSHALNSLETVTTSLLSQNFAHFTPVTKIGSWPKVGYYG